MAAVTASSAFAQATAQTDVDAISSGLLAKYNVGAGAALGALALGFAVYFIRKGVALRK